MKKVTIIFTIILSLSLVSCSSIFNCENGSGNLESKQIDLSKIKKVELSGSGNLLYVDSDENIVKVQTDDNLLDKVIFEIKDDVLEIYVKDRICPTTMNILLKCPDLENLEISGAFNVLAKEKITAKEFEIEVSGSGNVVFQDVDIDNLEIEISGSGDVNIVGKAGETEVEISGSGDIKCPELTTDKIKAEIFGSGDIIIDVKDEIDFKVFGSGDLIYTGDPKVIKKETFGSGSMTKKAKPENK